MKLEHIFQIKDCKKRGNTDSPWLMIGLGTENILLNVFYKARKLATSTWCNGYQTCLPRSNTTE